MIKNLYVFDYDGCIMLTPLPEEGKKEWSKYYDKPYPHRGWWGREESLDPDVFKIKANNDLLKDFERAKKDPEGMVIILTSRLPFLKKLILYHLKENNLEFDDYKFKSGIKEKPDVIDEILVKHLSIENVEVWDDRDKEFELYEKWIPVRTINFKLNKVKDGRSK